MRLVTAHAAPTSEDASLTFHRSEMNAGAEAHLLAAAGLVHQRGGTLSARARQQVVAQLVEYAFSRRLSR